MGATDTSQARALSRLVLQRGIATLDELLSAWAEYGRRETVDFAVVLCEWLEIPPERIAPLLRLVEQQAGDTSREGETLLVSLSDDDSDATLVDIRPAPAQKSEYLSLETVRSRYRVKSEIGAGGSGRVLAVADELLGRRIALKVLREGAAAGPERERKFVREASAAARLEHPNIVPVYDAGRLPTGEAFFTMRLIDGKSLKEVLSGMASGDAGLLERFGFVRLLTIFQQVCLAIDYAHGLGIIHRDIKPDNILIGEYGETLVTDWGLARQLDETRKEKPEEASGTPAYMSPEQAMGHSREIDHVSDVYGLGALLYEILTLQPPYTGDTPMAIMQAVIDEPIIPPSVRAPSRKIPTELEAICLQALSKERKNRPQSARLLFEATEQLLEGKREKRLMRRRAKTIAAEAEQETLRFRAQKARLDRLQKEREQAIDKGREDLWAMEEVVQDAQLQCDRIFFESVDRLTEALNLDPDQVEARSLLAELYHLRYQDAARAQNKKEMIYNRRMVELYDSQRGQRVLYDPATVSIFSQPQGAEVWAATVEERNGVLTAGDPMMMGNTPLKAVSMKRGLWMITLRQKGFSEAPYPLLLEAGERLNISVPLLPEDFADHRMAWVPPGAFIKGGDDRATGNEKSRAIDLDGFLIARQPVSLDAYATFLKDASRKRFRHEGYAPLPPRLQSDGGWLFGKDGLSHDVEKDWPAIGISWHDASAYAAWLSEKEGVPYALPTDEQWEKAARGSDGRTLPWGNRFDPGLCHMRDTLRRAQPRPISAYPRDRSPYGVFGLAGGVREWCADWLNPSADIKLTKGGSWLDPESICHSASRLGMPADGVKPNIGFRLVRILPEELRRIG